MTELREAISKLRLVVEGPPTVADLIAAFSAPSGGAPAKAAAKPTRKVVSFSPPPKKYVYHDRSILPAGNIDVATGSNEYWDDGYNEIWSEGGRRFVVHSSGERPDDAFGAIESFRHDQTGRSLRKNAVFVGWFTTDPNGEQAGEVPVKGKLPVATYK